MISSLTGRGSVRRRESREGTYKGEVSQIMRRDENRVYAYNESGMWIMSHVVVADLGFTMLLTSQVISVAFYSEHEKSDKICSEALIST